MQADVLTFQMKKINITILGTLLCVSAASSAATAPVTIQCPEQVPGKRMPTDFKWDGRQFAQTRVDGRTFSRQVDAAKEGQGAFNGATTKTWSFQLVPVPSEDRPNRRDYVALELVPEANPGNVTLYFKMATLESGFLVETLLQPWQGCSVITP